MILYKLWARDENKNLDVSKIANFDDNVHMKEVIEYAEQWAKKYGYKLKTIDQVFSGKKGNYKTRDNRNERGRIGDRRTGGRMGKVF